MIYFSTRGQGTIEYLVIIAVVVVISLVVVGLTGGIFGNSAQQVITGSSDLSSKTGTLTSGISVVEGVVDSSGNGLVRLSNLTGEDFTLTKVSAVSSSGSLIDNNFASTFVSSSGNVTFSLSDLGAACSCGAGETSKSCTFIISYVTPSGLTKTQTVTTNVDCVVDSNVSSVGNVVNPVLNGLCGTNAKAYLFSETSYDGTFCSAGTASPSLPTFPAQGTTINWVCDGNNGGTNANCSAVRGAAPTSFIFQVETSSDSETFSFQADDAVNLNVNWGDGASDSYSGTDLRSHVYATAGDYNVEVYGDASRISFGEGTPILLKDIFTPVSDGVTGITSAVNMFENTIVNSFTSKDFFTTASQNVNDVSFMFAFSQFNQDISDWNTSKVSNMRYMFYSSSFNQPIDGWDTSRVENMLSMFYGSSFNQPIGDWNTSGVSEMGAMFYHSSFNQPIGGWNTSNVTDMDSMFYRSSFNQNIGDWNTPKVTNMRSMFRNDTSFNQDLSNWNVLNVINHTDFNTGATAWVLPKPNFSS